MRLNWCQTLDGAFCRSANYQNNPHISLKLKAADCKIKREKSEIERVNKGKGNLYRMDDYNDELKTFLKITNEEDKTPKSQATLKHSPKVDQWWSLR